MKNTPYYFTLFLLLSLYSCSNDEKEVELDKDGKAMCGSVDECLAIYDFERARKFIGKGESPDAIVMYPEDQDTKTITIAESKYWADQGEIDKALSIIDETWGIEDYVWPEADWQSWRYNIIDKGVASLCEKSEFKQAKGLALKAAEDINVDGLKIGSDAGERDEHGNHIKAKGPSMQETLLKKISKYEELLK